MSSAEKEIVALSVAVFHAALLRDEADRAVFLRDDLRHELGEALHLVGCGSARNVTLNFLSRPCRPAGCFCPTLSCCELRVLGLVVGDRRQVRLHLADEDRVRLDAAVLELPPVEGELPERPVDDDAARPLARVLGAGFGEEVAELVLEGALREPQLTDAAALRARRPGQLLDASRLRTRRGGAFSASSSHSKSGTSATS